MCSASDRQFRGFFIRLGSENEDRNLRRGLNEPGERLHPAAVRHERSTKTAAIRSASRPSCAPFLASTLSPAAQCLTHSTWKGPIARMNQRVSNGK